MLNKQMWMSEAIIKSIQWVHEISEFARNKWQLNYSSKWKKNKKKTINYTVFSLGELGTVLWATSIHKVRTDKVRATLELHTHSSTKLFQLTSCAADFYQSTIAFAFVSEDHKQCLKKNPAVTDKKLLFNDA